MKTKLTLLLLLVVLFIVPISHAQDTVTIRYWHTMSDPETEALTAQIAAFEEANPGIHVEPTRYAYDDFKQALLTAIAGDEAPEAARFDIVGVPEFADLGVLSPVDDLIPDYVTLSEGFFPGPQATTYWNGQHWGLPLNTNTQVLLYNAEQFEAAGLEAPTTIADFVTDACALTNGTEQYGFGMGGTYFWAPAPLFYAQGGVITDPEVTTSTGYINSETSVAAFQTLVDMYNDGCLSPNLLGGGIGTAEGHATGLYSMIIDGPWMKDIYANDYPDFEVNFAPVPAGENGSSSVVGGEDLVLFADTPAQEAAVTWANYLMSEDYQLAMAQVGVIPVLNSLVGNEALPDYFGVFMNDKLQTAQARTPSPHWGEIDNAISNAFQYALRGDKTVQQALDDAAVEIDALLAQ